MSKTRHNKARDTIQSEWKYCSHRQKLFPHGDDCNNISGTDAYYSYDNVSQTTMKSQHMNQHICELQGKVFMNRIWEWTACAERAAADLLRKHALRNRSRVEVLQTVKAVAGWGPRPPYHRGTSLKMGAGGARYCQDGVIHCHCQWAFGWHIRNMWLTS